MPDDGFALKDDFPAVSYDQWRAAATADLAGATFEQKLVTHTYEGIDIQPLYTRRDQLEAADDAGWPGQPPFVRGARPLGAVLDGWDLRQLHAYPDLAVTNRAILDDLAGGVTSLELRLDRAARGGLDAVDPAAADLAGRDGVMIYSADDLDAALADVQLALVGVSLDAGAAFVPAAAALAALWQRRGIAPAEARGAFNADPLAELARQGRLPYSPATACALVAELARWTSERYARVTAVAVDTSPYHASGATATQDIAFGIATAVEYLRAMTAGGLAVDAAARQVLFQFSLGTHHFLAIAKLRAARRLWWRVVSASGGSAAAGAMRSGARTGQRVLTRRDPHVNLLRNAVAVFAAGIGGADVITSVPFDEPCGPPDDFSRRVARNTLLILQEEAHLHRAIDPAGGSWFLERLTQQLAEAAWGIFQEIERQGGMMQALQSGFVAAEIDAAFSGRAKDIARRKEGITGVSEFPDVGEERLARPPLDFAALRDAAARRLGKSPRQPLPVLSAGGDRPAAALEAAARGASLGQMARALGFHRESVEIAPLAPRAFAEPFEALRDAADAWLAAHGRRPTAFLVNLGPASQHTARAAFAANFFAAGGFAVVTNDGFAEPTAASAAFAASGADVAVICSSDKLYAQHVPEVAGKLKVAGARIVVLAGNPGTSEAAWRAAGVDRFIFIKCDLLATLREILHDLGVLPG